MLRILLANEDYEVVVAETCEQAVTLAATDTFDLYVLDRHLPDGTGVELCQHLNEITPNVPCLFYSGDAYEYHRLEAIAAGADAYVAKPDIGGLIDNVRNLLAERDCAAAT
jgi:DNA-binding response OmpR family regulator